MEKISELVSVTEWDDYKGQETLKRHLRIKIQAAVAQVRLLEHTLLIGPPGAGKSTIVKLIAKMLGDEVLTLPMPMALDDFLYAIENWSGIVFIDEIHNASRAFMEALQFGLHDGYIPGRYGERYSTANITFIAATTTNEQKRLLGPLVERFKFRPAWEPYTDAEMAEIIAGMATRAGIEISTEVALGLAGAASGNPRTLQNLVASARDLLAIGEEVTTEAVLELTGLDRDGLTKDHLAYIKVLHSVGGTAGLALLVNMLGMASQTVQDLERTLLTRGLLRLTPAGRRLTPQGGAKIDQAGNHGAPRVPRQPVSA